jgi:cell division protease FtsH
MDIFMNDLLKRIAETKETLSRVGTNLKKRFVGIDEMIDSVLDNLEVWHAMPELIGRPVIINLWGMTGVGKTDLVRQLAKELSMVDRFVEVQMANKSDSSSTSIRSILAHSSIEPDAKGILLLDEIQRYRTVDQNGVEIHDHDFQDVWMLLSDGCFAGDSSAKSEIVDLLFGDLYWQQYENRPEPTTAKAKKKKKEEAAKAKRIKYKQSIWAARHLKRTLRLTQSVDEIMMWDEEQKYHMLTDALNNQDTFEGDSYQQLLIFISGNIDEAYSMASNTDDADMDADIFYEFSKRINFVSIKRALCRRFKPEQIARLGNTHVIYPSLSKASYQEIVNRKVDEITQKMQEHGMRITVDQSVKDCIYRNGVFPAQGVRPVLSTVNAMLGNAVPGFFMKAVEHGVSEFLITCDDESQELVVAIGEHEFRRTIEGGIDKIKKEHDIQQVQLTAVHEAGHAVVYAVLTNLTPLQIIANTSMENKEGWVGIHHSSFSKDSILQRVCTNLAGMVAEDWVFGDPDRTAGCSGDVYYATNLIGSLIRQWAMNGRVSYSSNRHQDCNPVNFDIESTNAEIERIMSEQKERAKDLLERHRPLFEATVVALNDGTQGKLVGVISSVEFQAIAARFGTELEIQSAKETPYADYMGMFKQFTKSVAAEEVAT